MYYDNNPSLRSEFESDEKEIARGNSKTFKFIANNAKEICPSDNVRMKLRMDNSYKLSPRYGSNLHIILISCIFSSSNIRQNRISIFDL